MSESGKNEVDWVREYKAKEELMRERKILEVCPKEFYRELFPKGSLQSTERDGKGNVIATQIGEKWVEIKSQGKIGYIRRSDFDESFSEISLNIG